MLRNISRDYNTRPILSSLGFNVYRSSTVGKRKFCTINVMTVISDIEDMIQGVNANKISAYSDILYCGYLKPYILLDGIVIPTKNRHNSEKLYRELKQNPEKKQALIQRLQFIQYQLAAAGRFYNLRTA